MALSVFSRFKDAIVLLSVCVLASCGGSTVTPVDQTPERFTAWQDEVPPYLIGPGDKLSIYFQLTPEMNETVVVLPDGRVSLKSAGIVDVLDLSVEAASAKLEKQAKKVLQNPIMTLAVTDPVSAQIYVDGAVRNPGAYPLHGRIGVIEAVAKANGFRDTAQLGTIALVRRSPQNTPMLRVIDMKGILEGRVSAQQADVPLAPGDIIFVPRSGIAEFDLWIDQFVNQALPFSRAFSYTLNRDM